MSIEFVHIKQISDLEKSGFGTVLAGGTSSKLGRAIFEVNLKEGLLTILEFGFTLVTGGLAIDIEFVRISAINSCLNGWVISDAARDNDFDRLLPLEICHEESVLIIHIGMQSYSRFMLFFIELWRESKR